MVNVVEGEFAPFLLEEFDRVGEGAGMGRQGDGVDGAGRDAGEDRDAEFRIPFAHGRKHADLIRRPGAAPGARTIIGR